jgi:hypothetical protein
VDHPPERLPPRSLVGTVESVRFEHSPFVRFGTQVVLLVIAIPLASKASVAAARGLGAVLAILAIGAAVATPIALDLWAMVAADRDGISWRNRVVVRRLPWSAVAGFADGLGGTVLCRTDGGEVPLRVLGSRYLGSRRLAAQRVHILEELRRGAAP